MSDPRKLVGRYVVQEFGDGEFYWHAYLGDDRVNGGLCTEHLDGVRAAKNAITIARANLLRDDYFWDMETHSWLPKSELQH